MVEAGIVEYEILAMGDERMCPICGALNGQTFSVRGAQRVINHALSIDDPDKFKKAMPWHTQSPAGMSKGKLIQDKQYQAEYDRIQQEKGEAAKRNDFKTYDRLLKREEKLIEDRRKIRDELKAAKIETAEKSIMFASGISEKLDEADI